ncbi:hypothetical protein [Caballeronia sordidicola]|uniref:Uncharacterized protein n=1 Tax=Caballeronia sordidicola TaxID=196367 RepID=A0A242MZD4_CABSO|nr:hypothetical protein [Caballeronia sordidicola]OTP76494.1 hypothetical protein PAMC26577_10520 [Caballeronia sordidicola]
MERNSVGAGIALEDASVEIGLGAKGCVETRRVYTDGISNIGDAYSVVAAGVKEPLSGGDRLVEIEAAWAAARTGYICSHDYKIL